MELKAAQFGISVRLPSGSDRAYVDITHQEYRGLRLFHLGRAIRLVDTMRDNAVIYIQVDNVKACTPLKADGKGEEIFRTYSPYDPDGSLMDELKEDELPKKKLGRPKNSERKATPILPAARPETLG